MGWRVGVKCRLAPHNSRNPTRHQRFQRVTYSSRRAARFRAVFCVAHKADEAMKPCRAILKRSLCEPKRGRGGNATTDFPIADVAQRRLCVDNGLSLIMRTIASSEEITCKMWRNPWRNSAVSGGAVRVLLVTRSWRSWRRQFESSGLLRLSNGPYGDDNSAYLGKNRPGACEVI